jgi:hypothetical protein
VRGWDPAMWDLGGGEIESGEAGASSVSLNHQNYCIWIFNLILLLDCGWKFLVSLYAAV